MFFFSPCLYTYETMRTSGRWGGFKERIEVLNPVLRIPHSIRLLAYDTMESL